MALIQKGGGEGPRKYWPETEIIGIFFIVLAHKNIYSFNNKTEIEKITDQ